jgi:hypothetical protein
MGYGVEKIHAQFPNSNGNFTEARQFFNTCNFLKLDLGIMPGDLEASFVNLSMEENNTMTMTATMIVGGVTNASLLVHIRTYLSIAMTTINMAESGTVVVAKR